jgi:hypothetical protein
MAATVSHFRTQRVRNLGLIADAAQSSATLVCRFLEAYIAVKARIAVSYQRIRVLAALPS